MNIVYDYSHKFYKKKLRKKKVFDKKLKCKRRKLEFSVIIIFQNVGFLGAKSEDRQESVEREETSKVAWGGIL